MKKNILVVGLDYEFTGAVAKELSKEFDMFFLDVNGLIEYNLIDSKKVQVVCGKKYFENEKHKIILSVCDYENTIINFPYSVFLEEGISDKFLQTAVIIYLNVSKKLIHQQNEKNGEFVTELITYDELKKLLKNKSEITIPCLTLSVDKCVEKIKAKLQQL